MQQEVENRDPVFLPGLFRDQVVLVTGGGTGIGKEVALEVGKLGGKIALCGRRLEPLQETAKALKEQGISVFFDQCDIRESEHVEQFIKKVLAHYGRIDVLVNNAGGQFPILAEHLNAKGFNAVIRNNLVGTWNMTSAAARLAFIPQKSGRVVNVIAVIARGFPGMVHTGAARAGVDNLTKTLAVEWAIHNIKINAVAPGVIVSSGTDRYPPIALERARENTPLQRCGTCQEVSHLITFLASEKAASYITGQTYYIDGGASLWGDTFQMVGRPTSSSNDTTKAKL